MEELKKCPFCPNGIAEKERIFMVGWVIKCGSCGASSPVKNRLEEAITAWNTRKPMDRIVERLEEVSFPDIDETYVSDGQRMLFLHDAIKIVKEKLLQTDI